MYGGQFTGSSAVENKRCIGVLLQETGRNRIRHFAFDGALYDGGLVLTESENDNLPGLHDCTDAHGQSLLRHVLFAEKIARRITPRYGIERGQARTAVARGAGLVKTDMARTADTQDLQVDPAGAANHLLVTRTVIRGFFLGDRAARDMNIFRAYVDLIE